MRRLSLRGEDGCEVGAAGNAELLVDALQAVLDGAHRQEQFFGDLLVGAAAGGEEGGFPFGGYKQSGLGRERGPEGLESFLELKSVAFPRDGGPSPMDGSR